MEFTIIIIFVIIAIVIRLCAGSFDAERVERHIKDMGGELVDKSWDPFGPGWFGEKDSRIYEIVYRDRTGSLRRAHVKTSMLSGVYLTNDKPADDLSGSVESVEDEKTRLRRRLEELESQDR